ncbi:MAG: inorganic diphosphatase [Anaerolineaceae bacterium]|nr:inorganic diphosphatase [Anaerolineaceae bacterium]MBN2676699.1 inorganic diphosphatase [Anaerolineaceae bacterium]
MWGVQGIDHGIADDKIIAVLSYDPCWQAIKDIEELPGTLIDRLCHYFSVDMITDGQDGSMTIGKVYGCEHAKKVIEAAIEDYIQEYS